MPGREATEGRIVVYCVVPWTLAAKLHEPLRRHFLEDPTVEVVVERREADRRRRPERRRPDDSGGAPAAWRRIHNLEGRRIDDRRALISDAAAPPLPRQARRYVDQLRFIERLEPSSEHAEDIDTARLITRFQAGDRDLFTQLYLRYFDRVYKYLRLVIGDVHEAEDLAQVVFMRAFEALPRYERRSQPFRAWLFRIARNQALTELRKLGRTEVVDADDLAREKETHPQPAREAPGALTWISDNELLLFVERLPLAQRQVLLLRYMMGMSFPEIAETLDRSPEGVRKLHSRAVAFLEERLRAVGREVPRTGRSDALVYRRQVHVLRSRRFALLSPG